MPRYSAQSLGDFPHVMVRLACRKCGRSGQLSRDKLIVQHGRDIVLPDLLPLIADCPRSGRMHDPCGAHYADLAPSA